MRPVIDEFRREWEELSNFAPTPVYIHSHLEGREVMYATGEHAFNAAKTLNPQERAWVAAAPTPKEAKARGRQVKLRPGWDATIRYRAMRAVVEAKFRLGSGAAGRLLATGDALLVEGNTWHDQHWGDCRCGRSRCQAVGANWLGRMLMEQRDALRADPLLADGAT